MNKATEYSYQQYKYYVYTVYVLGHKNDQCFLLDYRKKLCLIFILQAMELFKFPLISKVKYENQTFTILRLRSLVYHF